MKNIRRAKRIRTKIKVSGRLRLSVFVSNKHIWAQIIDDQKGQTKVSANDLEVGGGKGIDVAVKVGELIAKKAKEAKIKKVVLDRGARKYHGRIKALAEGARKGGLTF